jgi:hypothetical protein
VVVVLVVGVVSLVVLSLLDVLLLMVDMSSGEVTTLSLKGAMVHDLPLVALVHLQRDRSGSPMVVLAVVALVSMMESIVLTPLWSRWLGTSFNLFVLTLVQSHLLTHMLICEFQVGGLGNVWLIDSGCSRHMTRDKE